jgi:spore maturation protein CgeB
MRGAFYLVERFDVLAVFFEPGWVVVLFEDDHDLADKAKYYLAHDSERNRIREAGLKRARSEHSWHRRFEKAFDQMGVN